MKMIIFSEGKIKTKEQTFSVNDCVWVDAVFGVGLHIYFGRLVSINDQNIILDISEKYHAKTVTVENKYITRVKQLFLE